MTLVDANPTIQQGVQPVGGPSSAFDNAVAAFRESVAHVLAAQQHLHRIKADTTSAIEAAGQQRLLARHLDEHATALTPGWLGCRFDDYSYDRALGVDVNAAARGHVIVHIGDAYPVDDARFSVVVPILDAGHLAIDVDARDAQVGGWMRGILLRLLAALPDGALRVLPVDGGTLGAAFNVFKPLIDAQVWARSATNAEMFRAALSEAEEQVAEAQAGQDNLPYLVIACAVLPQGTSSGDFARLAALAHAGPAARVHLLLCGYPPQRRAGVEQAPVLDYTTRLTSQGHDWFAVSEPPGKARFDMAGQGIPAPVKLDSGPPPELVAHVCGQLASSARSLQAIDFAALMPGEIWRESSATGLRTRVGRAGRDWVHLSLDDQTPHCLVGGRSGSGKTVFLTDVLYGLASRYSPDELSIYLLDFKEGISFAEFVPTAHDPTWIPHAATVGIESDREYGLAVLRALSREMGRRATQFKRAGVTTLADFRARTQDVAMPRIVAVIDEFQVLLAGNDKIAAEAVGLLEEIARKGRSYGEHLILASQTLSGIEALFTKSESIFGQFPLRVALSGGGGILGLLNKAADNLEVGTVVINKAAGDIDGNRLVKFPDAPAPALSAQRRMLWDKRSPGDQPPAVFAGYTEHDLDDDPAVRALNENVRRRHAFVGRAIDIGLPSAGFVLDATPGRHVAFLGTRADAVDMLHAATITLAKQHPSGTASFLLAPLVAAADVAAQEAARAIIEAGHTCKLLGADELADAYRTLVDNAAGDAAARRAAAAKPIYIIVWGADAVSGILATATKGRKGVDDFRKLLRHGPAYGVHLLAWWRTLARFNEDIGGSSGREDVACLVVTNLQAGDVTSLTGDYQLKWAPKPNRALLIDRHDDRRVLIVPYVRAGHDHHEAR